MKKVTVDNSIEINLPVITNPVNRVMKMTVPDISINQRFNSFTANLWNIGIKTSYGQLSIIDPDYKEELMNRFSDALSARNPKLISFTEELETLLNKYNK